MGTVTANQPFNGRSQEARWEFPENQMLRPAHRVMQIPQFRQEQHFLESGHG